MIKLNMYFIVFILLLIAFCFTNHRRISLPLKYSLIIGLIIRLGVTLIFYKSKSEDLISFIDAGEIILKRSSIYPTLYFPFFPYLGGLAVFLKNIFSPIIFLKIIFSVFDLGNIFFVYLLSKKNLSQAFLYALNPVTIISSNIHGQFDVIPIFFLLTGIYLLTKHKEIKSILMISFAVFTKTWPILFTIPIFIKLKNKLLFLLIIIIPLISVLFHWLYFKTPLIDILMPIKNYRGVYGYWGIGNILVLLWPKINGSAIQLLRRIFFIGLLTYSFFPNSKNVLKNILMVMLFFFTFTLTFGSQWLTWLVPFVILIKPKNWIRFYISATIYIIFAFAKNVYVFPFNVTTIFNTLETVFGFVTWILIIEQLLLPHSRRIHDLSHFRSRLKNFY